MRTHSITMIKQGKDPQRSLPVEGTRIRFLYDILYENRGFRLSKEDQAALVELCGGSSKHSGAIQALKTIWGCDIRRGALVGEWCGRDYVDYAAERVAA